MDISERDWYKRATAIPERMRDAARDDAILHSCLMGHISGALSYVQALEHAVEALAAERKRLMDLAVDRARLAPFPPIYVIHPET